MTALPSPGLLAAAARIVQLVEKKATTPANLTAQLPRIAYADSMQALELAVACLWLRLEAGDLYATVRGSEVSRLDADTRQRVMLRDYAVRVRPVWATLAHRGRQETVRFAPSGVVQSIREAGLLENPPSAPVAAWWDELAAFARSLASDSAEQTGRAGEQLSLEHENRRTGRWPRWTALESVFAGFDILSQVDRNNKDELRVEVKASRMPVASAIAHLSRNEWIVASSPGNQVFHLWELSASPRLAIIPSSEIVALAPLDRDGGEWSSMEFRFSRFKDFFRTVPSSKSDLSRS